MNWYVVYEVRNWEVKFTFRKSYPMHNYTSNVLVTVSTNPMIFEVETVETHSFKLHFHAC